MNDHIRRLSTILRQIKKSYSKKEKTSNQPPSSLLKQGTGKTLEKLQNIKTGTNWQSTFLANIDGKWWKSLQLFSDSDHGVDLPEPTAISKSCQRPKRNSWAQHLQMPSVLSRTNLKFWCFLPNWWSFSPHKSHPAAWRQNLVSRLQLKLRWSENIGKIELHNGPHFVPKSSANIAKITIPFQSCSSFDWVGRHRPNVVKVRKAILHHWHHVMNNQQPGTTHDATVYYLKSILCQIKNPTQ